MKNSRRLCVILGTRPEIIKMAPVIRCLEKNHVPYFMIHTAQHYSYQMDRIFFDSLKLPRPHVHFGSAPAVGGGHAAQTGRMLVQMEKVLLKERPRAVFVQGDTNTVLAGALTASKIPGIKIAHIEAGLRSYDRSMPEEVNRIMTDHISDFLFPPTPAAKKILIREGVSPKKIFMTGNTIVDAVRQNIKLTRGVLAKSKILPAGVEKYFLLTLHRQENVDSAETLARILEGLKRVIARYHVPILFPVHPRTEKRLKAFGLKLPNGVLAVPPVGFLEFLALEKGASLLLTDSGGVQEEGCILGVPCVTLRTSTERPETIAVGANLLAGHDPVKILACTDRMLRRKKTWKNPFGDGKSAERMVRIVQRAS